MTVSTAEEKPESVVEKDDRRKAPSTPDSKSGTSRRLHFSHNKATFVIVTLSTLLVGSGALLILEAIGLKLASKNTPIFFRIPSPFLSAFGFFTVTRIQQEQFLLIIGAVLVASPFIVDRYVYGLFRREKQLHLRAEKSMREASLLQDILTHDIRNFNQVSKMSAELITEELVQGNQNADHNNVQELVDQLVKSIDGSTKLVERAKLLGNVISDLNEERYPVDVLQSLNRSVSIVAKSLGPRGETQPDHTAYSSTSLRCVCKIGSSSPVPLEIALQEAQEAKELRKNMYNNAPMVLADSLLDHVFVNLISNSQRFDVLRYKEGGQNSVFISIECEKGYYKPPNPGYIEGRRRRKKISGWKLSIADLGSGIPEEVKKGLFSRLEGGKSNGLGMSIVYALVVERYGGLIEVKDRVKENYGKGTVVELWLPEAVSNGPGLV
jgi:signal transduction histidine kinase